MARKVSIAKDQLIASGVDFVTRFGLEALNARSLAAHMGCSIQPVFKNFGTMDGCKAAIVSALEAKYHEYIARRLDPADHLFTISLAHVQLAVDDRHLFAVIFQSALYRVRTVDEVVRSSWNRASIEGIRAQYGVPMRTAESTYRDVRFYTLGLAQAAYAGSVRFGAGECEALLRNAIAAFLAANGEGADGHA